MPRETSLPLVAPHRYSIRVWLAGVGFALFTIAKAQTTPLTPASIFEAALKHDPGVAAASFKLDEAAAKIRESQANGRPQASFQGQALQAQGHLPAGQGNDTFYTLQGSLNLQLPNLAKSHELTAGARAQLVAAQAALQRARADLAFEANDAYFGVLKAQDALAIAHQTLDQAQLQVSDTQKRISAGDIPSSDLLKAQVPFEQAKAGLARAEIALTSANQNLNSLMRVPLDSAAGVAPLASMPTFDLTEDQAIRQTLDSSPEIAQAKANVENSRHALEVVKRTLDPTLSLQATRTYTTDITTYLNLSSVGLLLNIPIFDGGIAKEQVKEAQLEFEQAKQALDQSEIQVKLNAATDFVSIESAKADYDSSVQVLGIAEESAVKARQAYEAGLTTTRDVLDALVALAQARSDVNNARYGYQLALAKLRQAAGDQQP